ncbi:hypothetical protein K8O68_16000 [Salipaludibacillus sp. CUR1]|uniref:DUF6944 family repetitive protein n=1 Tax=Salipaludibacillus sp. CUR1 TaxID=2820003 RepID=UPI001E49C835|nr:hypothetical protein [Salipaludibacillus sp. CUR1]MCE7793897.1 hypothetical protein [Salipaludibacillus sp. CUR1]
MQSTNIIRPNIKAVAEVTDEQLKLFTGAWLDATGSTLSASAAAGNLAGLNEINNKLTAVGEGLQAAGALIIGTVSADDPLDFAGNWIDGAGAATSSLAAYLQYIDEENGADNIRLDILGDSLQSMGASISALSDYSTGETGIAAGNALQGLGAGLEAIGGTYELREKEEAQLLNTVGAALQAIGATLNAILVTRDILLEVNCRWRSVLYKNKKDSQPKLVERL